MLLLEPLVLYSGHSHLVKPLILEQVRNELRLDVIESSGLDLAKSFLLNQLDDLPYGGTTQLGLSELPRPLHRVPLFEAEHQVKLLLHDSFLLGASLKLRRDELWGLLLRAVSLLKGSIGRFCLVLKLLTQSRH